MVHGENLILSLNGIIVATSKTCEIEFSQELIEAASPVCGADREYVPGKRGWTISAEGLCQTMNYVGSLQAGIFTPYTVQFYDTDSQIYRKGKCYITSLHVSGSIGKIVTYSVSLQGSGAFSGTIQTLHGKDVKAYQSNKELTTDSQYFEVTTGTLHNSVIKMMSLSVQSTDDIIFVTPEAGINHCLWVDGDSMSGFIVNGYTQFTQEIPISTTTRLSGYQPGTWYVLFDYIEPLIALKQDPDVVVKIYQ